jgi:hypothetical protein
MPDTRSCVHIVSHRILWGREATMRTNLAIATPCYGGQVTLIYHESIVKLFAACMANGIDLTPLAVGGDALITRARNELVARFLDGPGTHLLFVDADIGFEPEQVRRLLAFDADVTAAAYPIKSIEWERLKSMFERGEFRPPRLHHYVYAVADPSKIEGRDGFVRAIYAGTGFLMIRRPALERLCAAHPELRYRSTHSKKAYAEGSENRYALFDCLIDPETGVYLSEDYAFCKRWTDLGGEIWVDAESRLRHVGPMIFEGDLSTQLAAVTKKSAPPG